MKIGIFDSGFGGLTILKEIKHRMPEYSYVYLGDNARAPYGTRSFDTIYKYTLQAVETLFSRNCDLIILACNTASAKALRSIQQNDLQRLGSHKRVLGIIRPCTEIAGELTKTKALGIFATSGTVSSQSYEIEIAKLFPEIAVISHACPLWVSLVENGYTHSEGADFFIQQEIDALLAKEPKIDTILLACTHYPLLYDKIRAHTPAHIQVINQGKIVAESLHAYLRNHPEIETHCEKHGSIEFFTTENCEHFNAIASQFWGSEIHAQQLHYGGSEGSKR
ncbi:MAG: glutamate racemase [Bacteroidales bacterium]|nr:glutamate racemase [Bacteroidales bacterium]